MENSQRIVPYTTKSGLKIGSAYVRPVKVEMGDDALRLQRSFIDPGWRIEDTKPPSLYFAAAALCVVATLLMATLGK